jgi:hypothetical protein
MVNDFFIGSDHESIVKAADHLAEDVEEETLVFHLDEIDSLDLIHSPREYIDQIQRDYHCYVELEVP